MGWFLLSLLLLLWLWIVWPDTPDWGEKEFDNLVKDLERVKDV